MASLATPPPHPSVVIANMAEEFSRLPYRDTLTKTVSGSTGEPFFRISK